MLKVHSGHRYRPHRTVRLRLNTQVREKEGRVRPFSVFEPHNREQTYASGIPFCSAYCPERTHKYTFYPIKMQEIPTKRPLWTTIRSQPPAVSLHPSPAFLPAFCFHLPPPARRPPFSACRQLPPMRPCYMPPRRSAQAPPSEPRRTFPTGPRRTSPTGPRQTSLPAATDFPPRPRRTKKCDPKVALESFQEPYSEASASKEGL